MSDLAWTIIVILLIVVGGLGLFTISSSASPAAIAAFYGAHMRGTCLGIGGALLVPRLLSRSRGGWAHWIGIAWIFQGSFDIISVFPEHGFAQANALVYGCLFGIGIICACWFIRYRCIPEFMKLFRGD